MLPLLQYKNALTRGFLELDQHLKGLSAMATGEDHSGSTGIACLVTKDQLFVANCGASRCRLRRHLPCSALRCMLTCAHWRAQVIPAASCAGQAEQRRCQKTRSR